MCGNQIVSEQLSPGQKYKIVIFVRDCGATTGFSTQVSILKSDKELRDDESGNVLTLSDHYFGDYRNKYGGAEVKAEWTSNKTISIHFDSKADSGSKKYKANGIEIVYGEIR